jgi:hypothetical protein
MRRVYLAISLGIAFLFWNPGFALIPIIVGVLYFMHSRKVFRSFSTMFAHREEEVVTESIGVETEPTLITLVTRAPYELLGVDLEAGTSTILNSFYKRVKAERDDALKLNKNGRRLTAAKNEMMSRRRKQKQSPGKKDELESSLTNILEGWPVYSGKVIQFRNLAPSLMDKYQVGKEVSDLGLSISAESPECKGKGSHRLVIHSQNGRLLSGSGVGQVAFFPGTRFVVLSREPWQNPDFPDSPKGYSFELMEVA